MTDTVSNSVNGAAMLVTACYKVFDGILFFENNDSITGGFLKSGQYFKVIFLLCRYTMTHMKTVFILPTEAHSMC